MEGNAWSGEQHVLDPAYGHWPWPHVLAPHGHVCPRYRPGLGDGTSHTRILTVAAVLAFASPLALASPVAYGSSLGSADSVITWDRNAQAAIWDVAGQQPWV